MFNKDIKGKAGFERLFLKYLTSFKSYNHRMIAMMNEIIALHGRDEWKAVTLTHELHGHVGVYSIVGAKMGVYAMELFKVGKKQLKAKSFAGFTPPVSCMNDGIQASIGATVGNNLLEITHGKAEVSADFAFGNRQINIRLNQSSLVDLSLALSKAPGAPVRDNHAYWEYVEELALRYWLNWSRSQIFDWKEVL
jgi:pyrimidine-specific ribonucleoside hydrolase